MSNFSNNKLTTPQTAVFKKHNVHEVVTSLSEAKLIAEAHSNTHKYQHRAIVTLVGNPTLGVYDPVYLDGLPNGMSGYWTILSIKHIFGGKPAKYMIEAEVGTDLLGVMDPKAATRSSTRNVQGELAGQSLSAANSKLLTYSTSVNSSSLNPNYGTTPATAITKRSHTAVPSVLGSTPHKDASPDLSKVKRTVQWVNGKGK